MILSPTSVPTSPNGKPVGHWVKLYGNTSDTSLTFDPPVALSGVMASGASLQAGQVLSLGMVDRGVTKVKLDVLQ